MSAYSLLRSYQLSTLNVNRVQKGKKNENGPGPNLRITTCTLKEIFDPLENKHSLFLFLIRLRVIVQSGVCGNLSIIPARSHLATPDDHQVSLKR